MDSISVSSLRRLGAYALALGSASAALCVYALHSALPTNPLALPFSRELQLRAWLPEGWAFFTAPAQSEQRTPLVAEGDRWVNASFGPNAQARNAFGLRRNARLQNLEVEALVEQAPKATWQACSETPGHCLGRAPSVAVRNPFPRPTLCGDVGVVLQRPVPWAWATLPQDFAMPSRVLRLEVRC